MTLTFLEDVLPKAGEILMGYFGNATVTDRKDGNHHSVVTEADQKSQDFLVNAIRTAFPTHRIIAEEKGGDEMSVEDLTKGEVWFIDPLDGTRNFESRVPLFGINMAFARDGEILLAGIYLPATKELCLTEKGRGTTLNGKSIACSTATDIRKTFGIGPVRPREASLAFLQAFVNRYDDKCPYVNAIASTAVSSVYTADARRDWYVSRGSMIWDYAAPALILSEAGCIVTDTQGNPWKLGMTDFVASAPGVYKELIQIFT